MHASTMHINIQNDIYQSINVHLFYDNIIKHLSFLPPITKTYFNNDPKNAMILFYHHKCFQCENCKRLVLEMKC